MVVYRAAYFNESLLRESGVDVRVAQRVGDAWTRRRPATVLCDDGYIRGFIPGLEDPAEPKTAVGVLTEEQLHSLPPGSDLPMVRWTASGEVAWMGLEELAAYLVDVKPALRAPQQGGCCATCTLPEQVASLRNSISEALTTIDQAQTPEEFWARNKHQRLQRDACRRTAKEWFDRVAGDRPDLDKDTPYRRLYIKRFCQMRGIEDGFIDVLPDGRLVASEKYKVLQDD